MENRKKKTHKVKNNKKENWDAKKHFRGLKARKKGCSACYVQLSSRIFCIVLKH